MREKLRFHAPAFWFRPPGWASRLLQPLASVVAQIARRRRRRKGWRTPVPVLCVGNLTVGGTGKTTAVLDLVQRLQKRGVVAHCLTRGYGGQATKTGEAVRVDPEQHTARDVGDEALLLASVAPCWVCADRAVSARMAVAHGAECLVMDDGFQNPGLHKDLSLVLVDGAVGFGNGCVLPAGPLREDLVSGLAAADAVVITGEDRVGVATDLRAGQLPVLIAALHMEKMPAPFKEKRVIAFAGLARPEKFFEGLRANGVQPVGCIPFPDHHMFTEKDLAHLTTLAHENDALLVTTPKDAVKLPAAFRRTVAVIGVTLQWQEPAIIDGLLDRLMKEKAA